MRTVKVTAYGQRNMQFAVLHAEAPEGTSINGEVGRLLKDAVAEGLRSLGGRITNLRERAVRLKKVPGREAVATLQVDGMRFGVRIRAFIRPKCIYQVLMIAFPRDMKRKDAKRYFESMRFND
ncbi:MAG TPA: hypothetical protein DEA08_06455 [Planctomycetes bacterium]|nr:hypothetical protein [Planctomycetota bacterium]|tara:strand:+ start:39 stop:407 length:369 start_codon:yes stop_codon:yes gene_type:complete